MSSPSPPPPNEEDDDPASHFIRAAKSKQKVFLWVTFGALVCQIVSWTLEHGGAMKPVVGALQFLEVAFILADVALIVILLIHEICSAIRKFLNGVLPMVLLGIAVFSGGAILSPHLRVWLLELIEWLKEQLS